MHRCLQFEEQSPVEYTKQVLLTSLLHCCVKLSPGGYPVDLPENSMQVELVVECIRVSSNPQTHHHALLLLAYMANMIPVCSALSLHSKTKLIVCPQHWQYFNPCFLLFVYKWFFGFVVGMETRFGFKFKTRSRQKFETRTRRDYRFHWNREIFVSADLNALWIIQFKLKSV